MIYLLIISCMQILGTSAITLFLASVEIEEAFACSTNSINAQSGILYGIPVLVMIIVAYGIYRFLLLAILSEKDNMQMRKGKIIIIQAMALLIGLFFINYVIQWSLKLLC